MRAGNRHERNESRRVLAPRFRANGGGIVNRIAVLHATVVEVPGREGDDGPVAVGNLRYLRGTPPRRSLD